MLFLGSLLLLWLGALPPSAKAQNTPLKLHSLEVDIWPEYDRPSVLVIYRITLPKEIGLPVELRMRTPVAAGEPNALAMREADGTLINLVYSRNILGEWSEVVFTTTLPEVQLEYYDPSLKKEGPERTFHYQWPGDYAVDEFTLRVQRPLGAAEMRITPHTSNLAIGKDGLTYYVTQVDSLAAGQSFEVTIQYRKPSDALTAEGLQVQPSAPMGSATSSIPATENALPWLLGGLGLLLIFGSVAWWFWQARMVQPRKKTDRSRRRRLIIEPREVIPEGTVYCHHCGKRALPGDRFCRACGTKLRQ